MMRIDWGVYPDASFEALLRSGSAQALMAALRAPPVTVDRFAHLRLLDRLRELQPNDPELLAAWIPAMLMSNRPAPVYDLTSRWPVGAGPAPSWRLIAAQVAQTMGAHDEARARFRALLADRPDMIDAWQKFVEFEAPPDPTDSDVATVQALYDSASNDYVREKAAFALAAAWQRTDPGRAFRLADEAHRIKRRRNGAWDSVPVQHRLAVDRGRQPAAMSSQSDRRPVFVVGLPRSGTTVLTRILGSHPAVAGVGEQPLVPLWAAMAPRFESRGGAAFAQAWYRAALHDLARGARATVDKLPANAEQVGLILETFPDALVVWLERDFADCAMSMYMHDFESGFQYVDAATDLAMYGRMLRQHLLFWSERSADRVLRVRYEHLVDEPEGSLAPLLAAMGLNWEAAMLEFWKAGEQTATHSESQVRRPLNRAAVGAWRRFLPQAQEFARSLGVLD
jgi:hypothetical protein